MSLSERPDASEAGTAPFVVERVVPVPVGIEATVRLTDAAMRHTRAAPGLADEVLRRLPGIVRHRCECDSACGITAELADTESAHLLEHVALELLVRDGFPRTMRGKTEWDFRRDGHGVYRVFLGCENPLAARRALEEAVALLADLSNR